MFDTSAEAIYFTTIRRPEGMVRIESRWPSDAEWLERSRQLRLTQNRLGRGKTEMDLDPSGPDLKLYSKIKTPESPDLSQDEAKYYIGYLARCDVADVKLEGDQGTVELIITGAMHTKITVRIPTTAEAVQFQRAASRRIDLMHGREEYRFNMQAALDLYDKCAKSSEGYANGIPAIHRDMAIRTVINECEAQTEPADEDF